MPSNIYSLLRGLYRKVTLIVLYFVWYRCRENALILAGKGKLVTLTKWLQGRKRKSGFDGKIEIKNFKKKQFRRVPELLPLKTRVDVL